MTRWRIGLLVTWLASVGGAVGIACSSSDDDDVQRADGGGGSGAADASRDGTTLGAADGDILTDGGVDADGEVYDPTSACRAYIAASCTHSDYCHPKGVYYAVDGSVPQGPPAPLDECLGLEALCPEYVFGNGTTRTVAGIVACIADIEAFDCEQWNAGLAPACVTAGTLPADAGCLSAIQCASSSCGGRGVTATTVNCGTCTALPTNGQPCGQSGCLPGYACTEGTCAPVVVQHGLDAGAACAITQATEPCAAPYICGSTHTCVPYECGATVCAGQTVCNPTTHACEPPATSGQACSAAYCTDASTCYEDASPPTCGALFPLGSSCTATGQCIPTTYCSARYLECVPYNKEGQSCAQYGIECDPTTYCSPTTKVCTARTTTVGSACVVGSSGGDSCSGSNVCVATPDGGSICSPPGLDAIARGGDCTATGAVCADYLTCIGRTCTLPIGDCSSVDAGAGDR